MNKEKLLPSVKRTMLQDIVDRDFAIMTDKEILSIARVAYKRELNRMPDNALYDRYCDAYGIKGNPTYEEVVGVSKFQQ